MEIGFTEMEITAVKMISNDNSVRSAASKLKMKERYLEYHMAQIRLKTGLKTIGGIVAYFYRNKLIE